MFNGGSNNWEEHLQAPVGDNRRYSENSRNDNLVFNNNNSSSTSSYHQQSNSTNFSRSGLNPNAAPFQFNFNNSPLLTFNNSQNNSRVFENSSLVAVSGDSLRERLDEQLRKETYECMICCERIRWNHQIWSCTQCFHVFHLRCIKKWARTSATNENERNPNGGWRCPGCQHINIEVPMEYYCFCGQVCDPAPARGYDAPHSCGLLCKKSRNSECNHPCTLLCHPGACPPCPKIVEKFCLCGTTSNKVRCGADPFQCGKLCQKLLNCEVHICEQVCHRGPCSLCNETVKLECFCGKNTKVVPCSFDSANNSRYGCGEICGRKFLCGLHTCQKQCHDGDCGVCPQDPAVVTSCACGKTSLADLNVVRESCSDPVPSCDKICGKVLSCGPADNRHTCGALCHTGNCPTCPQTTATQCRCGSIKQNVPCEKFVLFSGKTFCCGCESCSTSCSSIVEENPFLCDRRCTKKRTCKQHKCNKMCCVDREHLCMLICGRKLSCGDHSCEMLCHAGKCRPCVNTSFDELRCFCGLAVIYPPVPCGTKPPVCDNLCTRDHSCDHPVAHSCHSEPNCPPCTHLTQKLCFCGHEYRRNIPCYMNDVSCGKECGKDLPCGQHKCTKICHGGDCINLDQKCYQPCLSPRPDCGHLCGSPCHVGRDCPSTPCLTMVTVSCACGRKTSRLTCFDVDRKVAAFKASIVARASKNNEIIDMNALERSNSVDRYKCIDCDEECARVERNKRLADALRVENADVAGDLGLPPYTEWLKSQYKTNAEFLINLEKTFNDLISTLKSTKAKTKTHVFPPMNRDHRRLVHEYAPFFVIETLSYDAEPVRNVVASAIQGKSSPPTVLLSSLMQKDSKPMPALRVAAPTVLNTRNFSSVPLSANMKTLSSNSSIFKRSPPS